MAAMAGRTSFKVAHEGHVVEMGGFGKAAAHHALEQSRQGLPVAALVDDDDRLAVEAEGPPGQDLEEFLQGAEAARQNREGVGPLEHLQLALVHGLDDDGFGERRMARLALQQEVRDDADDSATRIEGGIGHQAHQPDTAAAIDQRYALAGQQAAEADRRFAGGGIGAETGTAEDAEGERG